ncbi:general stress protein [uncultured Maribacter sp.]|uniref:general stress protein n=1 Tax=uncultured Maribacter sp. TaxID=431308 RepID=UPI0030ECE046|tara:strand:- start:31207 stop:31734 length:528 start_codon:yes stop_codon:yes gene_type:complete
MKNGVTVAICDSHQKAEKVVKELQESGFDMKKLSIVGKDYHEEDKVIGFYNTGDRMKNWGSAGAFWGGIWGLVFGSGFFLIPGVGPVMLAGPIVASLIGGLEGAVVVGGLSALGGALFGIGIPKNSVLQYETAIKADNFLVIAHGTEEELARAKKIMSDSSASEVNVHSEETVMS